MNATKLLSLEVLIESGLAVLLLALPRLTCRVCGLGDASFPFWPRMVGALLASLAVATVTTLAGWSRDGIGAGLGLAGHVVVNLVVAFVLASVLVIGGPLPTWRAKVILAATAAATLVMALLEVAYL